MKRDYANYQVALKILLRNKGRLLFLKTPEGKLDLPGGRIDNIEDEVPLIQILAREIREELGEDIKYNVGAPLLQYRRHFNLEGNPYHVFITVYDAELIAGEIHLSDEHVDFEWIDPQSFKFTLEQFFHKEEFDTLQNYFSGKK